MAVAQRRNTAAAGRDAGESGCRSGRLRARLCRRCFGERQGHRGHRLPEWQLDVRRLDRDLAVMTNGASVLADVVAEHLDEAEFLFELWSASARSPRSNLAEVQ